MALNEKLNGNMKNNPRRIKNSTRQMMRRIHTISNVNTIILLFIYFLLAGCGFYSLAGSIPSHIKSIAIPLLDNQTAEYGITEGITDNLLEKFTEANILRVVDEDNADSILRGIIKKVEEYSIKYKTPDPSVVLRVDQRLSVQDLVDVMKLGTEIKVRMILETKPE